MFKLRKKQVAKSKTELELAQLKGEISKLESLDLVRGFARTLRVEPVGETRQ